LNPNASTASWQAPDKVRPRRWPKVVAIAAAGLVAAQYLGGFLLLWSLGLNTRYASPLTIAEYAGYYSDVPMVRRRLLVCSGIGAAVVLGTSLVFLLPRRRALHGDARFASRAEIVGAGLLGQKGIILGQLGSRCLVLPGQQGVALAAPPRAGKGTGVVVPNLLHWPDSVICVDIKRENWQLTAGFRQKHGHACFLFDPFAEDGRTAHWNPFHYVSAEPMKRVNDLQRIAEMLYPDPPNVDPFWTASARSLFLGIALYLFETPSIPKTIGEVLRQGMASDNEGFGEHWKRLVEGRKSGPHPLSRECVRALYDIIDLAPVTGSSIRKTFTSRLDLWLNPILDAATATNDFDLRKLRSKPFSIYVGVNPDDLHRLRPVLALFFQQAIGLQTRALPEHDSSAKRQVLMLLDEFTALGRIPIIAESISYLPGYNVRVLLVIQTPAQLREVYGSHGADIMLKSLGARIVFAPKDHADAREISDELGNTTIKVKSYSSPLWDLSSSKGKRSRSVNVSEQRRPLLLPQEVKELGSEEAIIFYEGLRPIRCRKIRYYSDKRFTQRLHPPPAEATPLNHPTARVTPAINPVVEGGSPHPVPESPEFRDSLNSPTHTPPATREPTMEDLDRIEDIGLNDLAVDFSQVELPHKKERLTEREMQHAVDSFMASLRAR
jgi:type IV secretion system protein VirD4